MPLPGRIFIRDLELKVLVGCLPHERLAPQPLVFNLELALDMAAPAASDAIADALDYAALEQQVIAFAQASSFELLERLAACLAQALMDAHPALQSCLVRIAKPRALAVARTVEVQIELRRP